MNSATKTNSIPIALFILAFFAAWTVRATVLFTIDESIPPGLLRTAFSTAVKIFIWCGLGAGFVILVRRSNPLYYCGIIHPIDLPFVAKCLLVASIFVVALIAVEISFGGEGSSTLKENVSLIGFLVLVGSPIIEELLFRGLISKEIALLFPGLLANTVTSLIFVGIHLPFWLYHIGPTEQVAVDSVAIFIFSMIAGWLYLKTRSVWPASVAHIGNNMVALSLAQ